MVDIKFAGETIPMGGNMMNCEICGKSKDRETEMFDVQLCIPTIKYSDNETLGFVLKDVCKECAFIIAELIQDGIPLTYMKK